MLLCLPKVHNQILSFGDMRLLSWHQTDRLATSSRLAFSSLPAIRPTTTVSSANLIMVLELNLATQACVYREYIRGLRTQPWEDPEDADVVLDLSQNIS